ncbi:hypothetical protein R3P38DRAFT_1450584 [Favolaschia claudopus]|uniref:Uncharacterized protein n=1 Tax=Favolaschia claudopus TaxID=2862362 RepID=A0AAW0ANC8_9AGAR
MSPLPRRLLHALVADPRARVYTLRVLLVFSCISIGLLVAAIHVYYLLGVWNYYHGDTLFMPSYIAGVIGHGLLILHHISFAVLSVKMKINSLILTLDTVLILVEMGLISIPLMIYFTATGTDKMPNWNARSYVTELNLSLVTINPEVCFRVADSITLCALALCLAFRVYTRKKNESGFLGGCTSVSPSYTPAAILLNRSLLRPLMRAEPMWIVLLRAFVLTCLGIILPVYAVYSIILRPANSALYLKQYVSDSGLAAQDTPPGNISFYIHPLDRYQEFRKELMVINATAILTGEAESLGKPSACSVGDPQAPSDRPDLRRVEVHCPFEWQDLSNYIQFSFVFASNVNMSGITLVHNPWSSISGFDMTGNLNTDGGLLFRTSRKTQPTLLLARSRQFGIIMWSATRLKTDLQVSSEVIMIPEITNVQADTLSQASVDIPDVGTFRLAWLNSALSSYSEEYSDSSVLSGLANVGGFWTILNGAFALVFGANVLYFMFAMRPISALGMAHLFHRSSLTQRWHQDFPALRSEGGVPGSETAGIVAFIRDRMVDVGEDPEGINHPANDSKTGEEQGLTSETPDSEALAMSVVARTN